MKKTVLITGASTGIGKAAANLFAARGWNVAATMRRPEIETGFTRLSTVKVLRLDVTDPSSIEKAVNDTIAHFGQLDVIVNNAGYGAVGIFEAATDLQIRNQFDTNVFGVMNVTRVVLPYFRSMQSGTIINISSLAGLIAFPLYSVYHGTKWAIEGFSESLMFELRQFNIKVKLVEPGAIKTDFYSRSQELFQKEGLTDYDEYQNKIYPKTQQYGAKAPGPEVVAERIFEAATDDSFKLRYPVDKRGGFLLMIRRILPYSWFHWIVRKALS